MPLTPELLDELLKDYNKPDDLLGQEGLLQHALESGPGMNDHVYYRHRSDSLARAIASQVVRTLSR